MYSELPELVFDNVKLRPITLNDTDLIVNWRNNPKVKQFFIYQDEFTKETHERWFYEKIINGDVVQYIIEILEQGKSCIPIGSVYYRDINVDFKSAEFGIFIGEDIHRGKGIGTRVCKEFTEFGHKTLGFHRIFLRVLSKNLQAYKAYKKVGYRVEGVFSDMVKISEKYEDVIFMSSFDNSL